MSTERSNERSAAKSMRGEVLGGKYRIEEVLGRGGMGIVVAATHLQLEQRVAIKYLLRPENEEIVARFLREARAVVRLRGEHVARVTDVGTFDDGVPYMVMEYLDGIDLLKYLQQNGPLRVDEAIDYVLQTCEAIAEAHTQGIIHRDLKPANLFLTTAPDDSKSIKVLDFGISKVSDDHAQGPDKNELTNTATVLGSPYYMSPEQLKSTRTVDTRGDIWSLGVILFQLLAGKVPFTGKTSFEVGLKATYEQPPSLAKMRHDIPTELEKVILKCLEKKPEDRFGDVAELALNLAPFGLPTARASAEKTKRVFDAGMAGPSSRRGEAAMSAPASSRRTEAANSAPPSKTLEIIIPASGSQLPETVASPVAALDTQSNVATVPMPTIATRPKVRLKIVAGVVFVLALVLVGGIAVLQNATNGPDERRVGAESTAAREDKRVLDVQPAAAFPTDAPAPSASASSMIRTPVRSAKSASASKVDGAAPISTPATKTNTAKNPLKEVGIE